MWSGRGTLRQNYRSGSREIDLIMMDGDTIVFAEVKSRSKTRFGTPKRNSDERKAAAADARGAGVSDAGEFYGYTRAVRRFGGISSSGEVRHIVNVRSTRRDQA
ncbi:MAG: YraN family protein [Eubacteriales bacterium]